MPWHPRLPGHHHLHPLPALPETRAPSLLACLHAAVQLMLMVSYMLQRYTRPFVRTCAMADIRKFTALGLQVEALQGLPTAGLRRIARDKPCSWQGPLGAPRNPMDRWYRKAYGGSIEWSDDLGCSRRTDLAFCTFPTSSRTRELVRACRGTLSNNITCDPGRCSSQSPARLDDAERLVVCSLVTIHAHLAGRSRCRHRTSKPRPSH